MGQLLRGLRAAAPGRTAGPPGNGTTWAVLSVLFLGWNRGPPFVFWEAIPVSSALWGPMFPEPLLGPKAPARGQHITGTPLILLNNQFIPALLLGKGRSCLERDNLPL